MGAYSVASASISLANNEQSVSNQQAVVVMELHGTATNNSTQYVRHYPPRYDRLRPSHGTVQNKNVGGTGTFPNTETLFIDGDSISLSYPPDGKPSLIPDGLILNEEGSSTSYSYEFDQDSATFKFNQPIMGSFVCSYTTSYVILEYKPETVGDADVYGYIYSWYKGTKTNFKVPPPDSPDDYDQVRFAAVVRKAITDSEGSWEHHEGFPDEYFSGSDKPDEDAYSVEEIDVYLWYAQAGRLALFTDKQGWEYFRPKLNASNYKPQFYFKKAQRPSEEWAAKLYDETDFDALFNTARQLYSNIKLEGDS